MTGRLHLIYHWRDCSFTDSLPLSPSLSLSLHRSQTEGPSSRKSSLTMPCLILITLTWRITAEGKILCINPLSGTLQNYQISSNLTLLKKQKSLVSGFIFIVLLGAGVCTFIPAHFGSWLGNVDIISPLGKLIGDPPVLCAPSQWLTVLSEICTCLCSLQPISLQHTALLCTH